MWKEVMCEGMKRLANFLRKVKAALTHKSRGYSDLVMIASAVITVVVVAIIGVYISQQIYQAANVDSSSPFYTSMQAAINIMDTSFPLLVVVVIAVVAGVIMTYLLGGFGFGGGEEKK